MGAVAKRKVGRPKATLDELPDDWQEQMLALYAEGGTDVECRVLIATWREYMSQNLWERWIQEYEEFGVTVKRGNNLARAWWEKRAREMAMNGIGNPTAMIFMMKNRWKDDYQDVKRIEGTVSHNHDHRAIQAIDSRIIELVGEGTGSDSTETVQDGSILPAGVRVRSE